MGFWIKAGAVVVVAGVAVGCLYYAYAAGRDLAAETARADKAEDQLRLSQASLKIWIDSATTLAVASKADAARAERFANQLADSEKLKEELLNENIKLERAICIKRDGTKRLRDYFTATDLGGSEAEPSGSPK
jgi:hypothetical protein